VGSLKRYRKLDALGEGGAGLVYRALDTAEDEVVALKLLRSGLAESTVAQRMQREIRTLRRLDHPAIVRVRDAGVETNGAPFLVMDYVEGHTLGERVRATGPLPQQEAAAVVLRLSEALEHAHDQGILHRDVKPDNVLLDRQGRAFLTDFGLALELHEMERLTRSGAFLGTPGFLAPEQARGERAEIRPATDVYGLGGVLYFALTGRAPCTGSGLHQVIIATLKQRPRPVRELRPEVDPELEAICLRCLAKDPVHRFDRASHLSQALRDYLGQGQVRRAAPLRALVAVSVLGAIAALASFLDLSAPPPEREDAPQRPRLGAPAEPEQPRVRSRLEQLLDRARELIHDGRLDRAKQEATEATALDPRSVDAWLVRAEVVTDLGQFEEAEAYLERAAGLAPEDSRVARQRGWVLRMQGELDGAYEAFSRALKLREDSGARLDRAMVSLEMGRRDAALADARAARDLGLTRLWDYAELLDLFEETGAVEDEQRAVEQLQALDLRTQEERETRAQVLLYPRPDLALLEANVLLQEDPESLRALIVRGRALVRLGRLEDALEPLSQALKRAPGRLDVIADRGRAYLRLKRLDEALEDWQLVVELDPHDARALAHLAYTHLLRLEIEEAEAVLIRLTESPWMPAEGYGAQALLAQYQGFPEQAVHSAKLALEADPALEWPRVVLARSLEALGQRRQALATWREIATWHRDPEDRALAEARVAALEKR